MSKYSEKQKLEFAIEQYELIKKNENCPFPLFTFCNQRIKALEKKLSELKEVGAKSVGLSDYIKSLFEKNSQLQIIPAKMNKKRACYALAILNKMQSELDLLMDNPEEETYAEYQEAIRWMKNQILKRGILLRKRFYEL